MQRLALLFCTEQFYTVVQYLLAVFQIISYRKETDDCSNIDSNVEGQDDSKTANLETQDISTNQAEDKPTCGNGSDDEETLYTGVNPFIEAQVTKLARNSIPAHLKELPDNCYHEGVPKEAVSSCKTSIF